MPKAEKTHTCRNCDWTRGNRCPFHGVTLTMELSGDGPGCYLAILKPRTCSAWKRRCEDPGLSDTWLPGWAAREAL